METPAISASAYSSAVYNPVLREPGWTGPTGATSMRAGAVGAATVLETLDLQNRKEFNMAQGARIVKVFIADSNESIPLDKRVLYSGEEKLTDLTDQELFFDVSISGLLTKHNEMRKTTIDKPQAEKFGRDIFLEPARIRDLKMVVVTVAQF